MPPARRRVLLLVGELSAYVRGVLAGVLRHALQRGDWDCRMAGWGDSSVAALQPPARVDGVIARVRDDATAASLIGYGRPVVNVANAHPGRVLPSVINDEEAIGRIAARHFLDRGFVSLAYLPFGGFAFVDERMAGFVDEARRRGVAAAVPSPIRGAADEFRAAALAFLAPLPKPVGVFASSDVAAHHASIACRDAGLAIPHDVALLGVDDDDLLCRLSDPPLSSIQPGTERIGEAAAELLDRLIDGAPPPPAPLRVPPVGLAARRSSDLAAVDDQVLATAMRCIRERACAGIHVDDVVSAVPCSRSELERRFREVLGTTVAAQIRLARFAEAKRLLRETGMPLAQVARACGFRDAKQFGAGFVRETGSTPLAWRQANRR